MAKKIMVFNDTEEIQELFQDILSAEGFEVTINSFSTHELDALRQLMPDLVIADCPPLQREEKGWQLIQKMKMSRDTDQIPIILCTTNLNAIEDSEGWLVAKGIVALPKPFTVDELVRAVRHQLGDPDRPGSTSVQSIAERSEAQEQE